MHSYINFFKSPTTVPSSPPSNYTAVSLSSHSILLTWDAPPVEGQNGIITGYIVNITELETGEVSAIFTESHNLTLYSLQPFTTYGCFVSAQTVAGRGPATRFVSETTELAVGSLHPFYTYTLFIVPVTVDVGTNHTEVTIRTEEAGD